MKCQAMTSVEFLLFTLVVLILADCEQSVTFLLCHSKNIESMREGRAAKPRNLPFSLASRSSEERTTTAHGL